MVDVITPLGSEELFNEVSLPALKALTTDPVVPNVRLAIARALFDLIPGLKSHEGCKGCLQLLSQDFEEGTCESKFHAI